MNASTLAKPVVASPVKKAEDGKYIVRLAARAVASYNGGVPGLAPTTKNGVPTAKVSGSAVSAYKDYLDSQRAAVLKAVPGVRVIYTYDTAFAGFAASMTFEQAEAMARTPGVAAVTPNDIFTVDTTRTPTFLGLDKPETGLWAQLGGPENAGEGIVIGDLDTGFSPESDSFAPLAEPAPVPAGWTGTCDAGDPADMGGGKADGTTGTGDQAAAIPCNGDVVNNKVIGARYYMGGSTPMDQEFISPRDLNGHGSHTGSTAGGDHAVPVTIAGVDLGLMSGMAPRARLAIYKVCWEQADATAGCSSLNSVAAIDQAVEDGVNVINYSISGALDSAADPVALAFMNAAAAGVFVSASAGNSGGSGTSAHNYPWVTTVAASTVDREFRVTVTTGDGDEFVGAGIATAVAETSAVYAGDIPADGHDPIEAARCYLDSIDPAKAAGKIVVCDRGTNARVQKSLVVKDAGGVGMVLANDGMSGTSIVTERHSVPTSNVVWQDGTAIKDYIKKEGADATLSISAYELALGQDVVAPAIAAFSSRGPGQVADGNILKPDVTAPGVSIIAALAPYDDNFNESFGFESGTSMSAPHVTGVAALEMALHPDWTPMEIKSALMTSAYQKNNHGDPIKANGINDATPMDFGAGHIDPNPAASTPLVYNTGPDEWMQFLCGTELPDDPSCAEVGGPIDPSDLNLPSIAVNGFAGTRDIVRTVTNVSGAAVSATVSYEQPVGYKISVSPSTIDVPAGGTATFTVTVSQTDDVVLDRWAFGAVTLTAGDSVMRSPVALQAVTFKAAALLAGSGSSGSVHDTVVSGIEQDVSIAMTGFSPGELDTAVLSHPDGTTFPTDPPPSDPLPDHIMHATTDVAEGQTMARFELFKDDYVSGTDLDMFVYREEDDGTLTFVKSSATPAANEMVQIDNPPAGTYHIYVDLYALAGGEESADVHLYSFILGTAGGEGDLTADPDHYSAEAGSSQDVTFSWKGLAPPAAGEASKRYLGWADYSSGDTKLARTLILADVPSNVTPTETPTETATPTQTATDTPTPIGTLPHTGAGSSTMTIGLIGLLALFFGGAVVLVARRRLRMQS